MITLCKDKNGTDLRVDSRPDLSGYNPGGTKCEVFIMTPADWRFSRTVTVSRQQHKDLTLEKSITGIMSGKSFK